MKTSLYISLTVGIALIAPAFNAGAQTTGERAIQGQARQVEIQGDSRKLVADLDATIDEYQRNGLDGDEIANLKKLRDVLSKTSDQEMAKILDLLQQAGSKTDPKAALKALADAYSAQKSVLSQLQYILNSYASAQSALDIAKQVRQLADRQAANLQTGIETAQWTLGNGNRDNNAAAAEFSIQGQASEQKSIADELKLIQTKIAALAASPDNQTLADRFKKGLDQINVLNPVLDSDAGLLEQKKLFEAVTGEKTARDGLRQLARTISPPQDEADALRAALEELDKIIALQKDQIPATNSFRLRPIEEWIAAELQVPGNLRKTATRLQQTGMSPAQLAQLDVYKSLYKEQFRLAKEHLAGLENPQGDIANQTDSLSQDITSIAKPAADALQSAMVPMQAARGALVDGQAVDALKSENDALAGLEKARAFLDQKLAEIAKTEKPGDEAAKVADMQKEAKDLLAEQAAIAKETAQPNTPEQEAALAKQQAALQQKTQELQQQAAAGSPQAAQSLNAAANNMQQAAGAMNNPAQPAQAQAQAQQAQAMQNLAAAGQQLGQQAAQMQQNAQQAAADQKALDALAKIIEQEQKLQLDTVQAAPKQKSQPQTVSSLAPRQQAIRQDTETFQGTLGAQTGGSPDPKLIASASNHMGDAHGHLGKADAMQAAPDEKKALDDLYAAQAALQAALQAAQAQPGADQNAAQQQAQAAQQAAQAQAAIAQAQQQVDQAMNALGQQPNAGQQAGQPDAGQPAAGQQAGQQAAANDFAQAATATGNAAAQDNALPADAQQGLQAANQALTQAAGQAAAGQDAQAKGDGQQAQAALAQAQAALAQAQAGLAANDQGQGQAGQGQGQPGQGQGQGQAGQGQGQGQAGQGQGQGQGGQGQGQGGSGSGGTGNNQITGEQTQGNGARTASKAQFLGLPPRDRTTIQQSQAEKYPQQYATKVEQYLQNLSDQGGKP